jgi:hypothetical protein
MLWRQSGEQGLDACKIRSCLRSCHFPSFIICLFIYLFIYLLLLLLLLLLFRVLLLFNSEIENVNAETNQNIFILFFKIYF